MATLKPCMTPGYSGHETLEYLVLSTLNKAAAGGHRNEIQLEKFAKSLGCKPDKLRSTLRNLSDSGHINTACVLDWSSISSFQLGEPIITCEPGQLNLDDDFDEPTIGTSLDAMSPTNDVELEFEGRKCRFAIRYDDEGKVNLVISEYKGKNWKVVVEQTHDDKESAVKYAREFVGEA